MKTLSIKQPWAWLIVNGYKNIENRTWPTRKTGKFLIHSPKTKDSVGYGIIRSILLEDDYTDADYEKFLLAQDTLAYGGIVGVAEITDCVSHVFKHSPWFCGPWGFVLTNAKPLPFKPCKGHLGFFDVDY